MIGNLPMRRWIPLLILSALSVAMLTLGWRKWPDPIVDFGRELYVPWRIVHGDVLYRDLAYFNGPLSPYFNALVFKLFGVGLMPLVGANLLIFAAIVTLLHRLLRLAGDSFSAVLGACLFVAMFGFLQLVEIGNYNYATPYSHELTHGLLLSLAAIHLALWHHRSAAAWRAAMIGLALGALFLTKVEMFLGGAAGTLAVVAATCWREGRSKFLATKLAMAGGFLLPIAAAFAALLPAMTAHDAIGGVIGSWKYVFDPHITAMPFYQRVAGLDATSTHLVAAASLTLGYAALAGAVYAIARATPRRHQLLVGGVGAIAIIVLAHLFFAQIPWQNLFRAAPIVLLLSLPLMLRRDATDSGGDDRALPARIGLFALAGALLLKIALNVTVQHYGFVLAMPAVMVIAWVFAFALPRAVARRGGSGLCARILCSAAAVVVAVVHVHVARTIYFDAKTISVGDGADRFFAGRRGAAVARVIAQLQADASPAATVACLPEGVMINYLTRRANPTPYFTLMPLEMRMFDPARILAAYQAHPPDYIVMVPHDTAEWGVRGFAEDYGHEIASWIASSYTDITRDRDERFPITLLRRN